MQRAIVDEPNDLYAADIPVYLDLKLYAGELWKMALDAMPAGIPLSELVSKGKVRFFIDSVNELPREYFESGTFERDVVAFINKIGSCTALFASRTGEGLQTADLTRFQLLNISKEFVENSLKGADVKLDGVYRSDLVRLLQKPLFFRQFCMGNIELQSYAHPALIYESFLDRFRVSLNAELGLQIPLDVSLGSLAYRAIDDGTEAFTLSDAIGQFRRHESTRGLGQEQIESVIDWLIVKNFFVPSAGMRLTFYHQSLTEFLAAKRLATLFSASPDVLEQCLQSTRWDQALFLALGFLDAEKTSTFVERVVRTDLALAVRAARYVEFDRDGVVAQVLTRVANVCGDFAYVHQLAHWLEQLPVSPVHEPLIEELLERGNVIGGAAARLLVALHGDQAKTRLINRLFERFDDFNYCQGLGMALASMIVSDDVGPIVVRLGELDNEVADGAYGTSTMLAEQSPDVIAASFRPLNKLNDPQLKVLCDWLCHHDNTAVGFQLLLDATNVDLYSPVFLLYLRLRCDDPEEKEMMSRLLDHTVVDRLFAGMEDMKPSPYAASALRHVCASRDDLAAYVAGRASSVIQSRRLPILFANVDREPEEFWKELRRLVEESEHGLTSQHIEVFESCHDIDWTGHESVFVSLLRLKDGRLAQKLLELPPSSLHDLTEHIQPIEWWLQWISECALVSEQTLLPDRLSGVLVEMTNDEVHRELIDVFNEPECSFREVMSDELMWRIPGLSIEDLSTDAVNYLMTQLHRKTRISFRELLLGRLVNEEFVNDKLLPLMSVREQPLRRNLIHVLQQAGERHRRRYVSDEDRGDETMHAENST